MKHRYVSWLVMLLFSLACTVVAQETKPAEKPRKTGLWPPDWVYTLAEGVTTREITFYSDGIGCYGKIFFPKGYSTTGKTPGIVLGQGWAGNHFSIEKYGARFAERGMVAMVIDYRGWGSSDGFIALSQPTVSRGEKEPVRDEKRHSNGKLDIVTKRTRLIPLKQVEDYRNAISYLQGEPGVDPDRIGVWGSSFAGGNVIVTAALDARVKAIAAQVPAVSGKNATTAPASLTGKLLEDAIQRARTGKGAEFETGFSYRRMVDLETNQMVAEYRPFHYLPRVGNRPVMFIVAEKEELFRNADNAVAAIEVLTGPKKLVTVPGITHFEMYISEAFEISSNAAAAWFREHLGLEPKVEVKPTGQ